MLLLGASARNFTGRLLSKSRTDGYGAISGRPSQELAGDHPKNWRETGPKDRRETRPQDWRETGPKDLRAAFTRVREAV